MLLKRFHYHHLNQNLKNQPNLNHLKKIQQQKFKPLLRNRFILANLDLFQCHKSYSLFDLVPSALFEGTFTAKPEKHLLITELEKHLLSTEYNFAKTSESKTSLVIDFMSLMRRIRLTNLQTFKESFEVMWKSILSVCEFNQLNII